MMVYLSVQSIAVTYNLLVFCRPLGSDVPYMVRYVVVDVMFVNQ